MFLKIYLPPKIDLLVISKILSCLQPAPFIPFNTDTNKVEQLYSYWRKRICVFLFLGYAVYYLTRKSFTYVMPYLAIDLGFTNADLGLIGSCLYITYGISKFYNGAVSDRSNPRYFMAIGLILTGLCNILFAFSSSFWALAFFWALNGFFQAWGWPACCKCFTYWFERTERGQAYSFTLTSQNVGSAIIPILAVFIAVPLGWRVAVLVPATISIFMGFILMIGLRDIPQSLGLPPLGDKAKVTTSHKKPSQAPSLSIREIMFKHVLNSKTVWAFAIVNFFVYFVRTAVCDWGVLYLMKERMLSDKLAASGLFWFEIAGIGGMLLAGAISDRYFKGHRVPIIILSGIGMTIAVVGLWVAPNNIFWFDLLFFAILGFFLFAPQMIIGLAATECVDKRAASSANGFAGTLGYLGATCACYPVGLSIDIYGWQGYYVTMIICSVLVFAVLLPFWSNKRMMSRVMA